MYFSTVYYLYNLKIVLQVICSSIIYTSLVVLNMTTITKIQMESRQWIPTEKKRKQIKMLISF